MFKNILYFLIGLLCEKRTDSFSKLFNQKNFSTEDLKELEEIKFSFKGNTKKTP